MRFVKGWFPLRIKQRLHWFCKLSITTTRIIFIFHLKIYWCSHRVIVTIIVTQNLLSWNQDRQRRDWYNVIFVFKTSKKKVVKKCKKEKVLDKENFWEMSFFVIFQLLQNKQGYSLTFSASDSSLPSKSGGFLMPFPNALQFIKLLFVIWKHVCSKQAGYFCNTKNVCSKQAVFSLLIIYKYCTLEYFYYEFHKKFLERYFYFT